VSALAEARPTERRRGGWLRRIALVLAVLAAIPFALTLLYAVVPPPSTLMLGRWLTGAPVDRRWVPLDEISPHLVRAVLTSEDAAFCRHWGIDVRAVREALREASDGGDARGASTITMQAAKNLFLWHGRSVVRKAIEAPLALVIDLVWPKRRVLEVYLNIAEWGPGVFGAEAAAQTHFRTSAARLDRRQAALLAAALPNPALRPAGRPSAQHRRLAARLEIRMERAPADASCVER
jgi:monofunctional biosynthetic peptidoglycan transglycosylase